MLLLCFKTSASITIFYDSQIWLLQGLKCFFVISYLQIIYWPCSIGDYWIHDKQNHTKVRNIEQIGFSCVKEDIWNTFGFINGWFYFTLWSSQYYLQVPTNLSKSIEFFPLLTYTLLYKSHNFQWHYFWCILSLLLLIRLFSIFLNFQYFPLKLILFLLLLGNLIIKYISGAYKLYLLLLCDSVQFPPFIYYLCLKCHYY